MEMDQNQVFATVQLVDDKVGLLSTSRDNPPIKTDYVPPIGYRDGYTPLELILVAFSSCLGTSVLTLLRAKMKRTISDFHVEASGTVKEEHPKTLSDISLNLIFTSGDLLEEEVKIALGAAEDAFCPVWALLKGNVDVKVAFEIKK